jgi:hypothetical protein
MPTARSAAADRAYVARLKAQRLELSRRLDATWARIHADAIQDSYGSSVAPIAARLITAGQASALGTTRGYIRALGVQLAEPFAKPGATLAGTTSDAIASIGSVVLGAIGEGRSVQDALDWGRELLVRTGDAEFTRTVDDETSGQAGATGRFVGWRGITYGAVDDCVQNEGDHTFDQDMVRHANCRCDRVLITA